MESALENPVPNKIAQVSDLIEVANRLAALTDRVRVQQNVDRSTAIAIKSVSTEVLSENYPINSFSRTLSSINYSVTVESLVSAVKDFTARVYKAMLDAWKAAVAWFKRLYDWVVELVSDTRREHDATDIVRKGTNEVIHKLPVAVRSKAEQALADAIANADASGKFENAKDYFTNSLVLSVVNQGWLYRLYDESFNAFDDYLDVSHQRIVALAHALKVYLGNNRTANLTVINWLESARDLTSSKQKTLQHAIRSQTATLDISTVSSGQCLVALKDLTISHKSDRHINADGLTIRSVIESKLNNLTAFPPHTRELFKRIEEDVDLQERALPNILIPDADVSAAVREVTAVIREDIIGLQAFKETQAVYVRLANNAAKLHTQYWWYLYHSVRDAVVSDKEASDIVISHVRTMNEKIKRL